MKRKRMEKELRNVFVYGTLKRGMYNSHFIPDAIINRIEQVTTKGRLYYVSSGSFPCLKLNGDNTIHGEMYTINKKNWKEVLKGMDDLEGCPTLYTREVIEVTNEDGKTFKAWAYIFNSEYMLGNEIPSGIFTGPDPYAYRNFQQNLYSYYYGDF